jgi:hypothetical protein
MEQFGKTILSAYPMLYGYVTQIEEVIKRRARNSFYARCDVVGLSEELLSLGEIRKDLIELKLIVEEVLSLIKPYDRVLLSYKYFGIAPQEEGFDLTSRNYFRRQIKALKNFSDTLVSRGYDEEWFRNKYLKIAFISGIYQRTILEQGKKHVRSY